MRWSEYDSPACGRGADIVKVLKAMDEPDEPCPVCDCGECPQDCKCECDRDATPIEREAGHEPVHRPE